MTPTKGLISLRVGYQPQSALLPGQRKEDNSEYRDAVTAMGELRKLWPDIMSQYPTSLRQRLNRVRRPRHGKALAPMIDATAIYDVNSIYKLIMSEKLTLGGQLCTKYSVKKARLHAMGAKVIQPNWMPEVLEHVPTIETWKEVRKTLNWKDRPPRHLEAYW